MTCKYKEYEVKIKMIGLAGGVDSTHPPVGNILSTYVRFNELQMSCKNPPTSQYDLSFYNYMEYITQWEYYT